MAKIFESNALELSANGFRPLLWLNQQLEALSNDQAFSYLLGAEDPEWIEDRAYLHSEANGIDLVFEQARGVLAIHIYPDYPGELPCSLSFGISRKAALAQLGTPQETGGGFPGRVLGWVPVWIKYQYDGFYLHLQFPQDGSGLDLITLGALESVSSAASGPGGVK